MTHHVEFSLSQSRRVCERRQDYQISYASIVHLLDREIALPPSALGEQNLSSPNRRVSSLRRQVFAPIFASGT